MTPAELKLISNCLTKNNIAIIELKQMFFFNFSQNLKLLKRLKFCEKF
jgi:hypothetical protein